MGILCPTGILNLDNAIGGGLPYTSSVLLMGDVGSGHREFAYTTIFRHDNEVKYPSGIEPPRQIYYITLSKSKGDVINELNLSFNKKYVDAFLSRTKFIDLSPEYFSHSIVPSRWLDHDDSPKDENPLNALVKFFDETMFENGEKSLVIIDSLTDLLIRSTVNFEQLILFLCGLQIASNKWNNLIYILHTQGIVDGKKEKQIMESMDGEMIFHWEEGTTERQRCMYLGKFRGMTPHLPVNGFVKFITTVTHDGFDITNLKFVK